MTCACHRSGRPDTSAWDPVRGRCGRCGQPYRRVVPLPPVLLEVPARPVVAEDLRPTDVGEPEGGER